MLQTLGSILEYTVIQYVLTMLMTKLIAHLSSGTSFGLEYEIQGTLAWLLVNVAAYGFHMMVDFYNPFHHSPSCRESNCSLLLSLSYQSK